MGRQLPVKRAVAVGVCSPIAQHEEPVLGEHGQERRQGVVEEVEPGDEGRRIAEPCRERIGGVARDDVVASAFDDREAWRQELLDVGAGEEPAVLVDRMAEPGVHLPHDELDPRGAVGQMEDEQRAAGLEHAGEFHERSLLIATGLVNVFEHAHAHGGNEAAVLERERDGVNRTGMSEQGLVPQPIGGLFKGKSHGAKPVLRQEVGKMSVAATPIENGATAW
jgi:hypothetical protein